MEMIYPYEFFITLTIVIQLLTALMMKMALTLFATVVKMVAMYMGSECWAGPLILSPAC